MKTGHGVETDIFNLLKDSSLLANLDGGLYRAGTRPRSSDREDLVIIFTTGDSEQVQEGVVTLNAYIPDIQIGTDGVSYENIARCEEVERLMAQEINGWKADRSGYYFRLADMVHTSREEDTHQSFVVAKVRFRLYEPR